MSAQITIPFKVEVKAKAKSSYTLDIIKRRLEIIAFDNRPQTINEREYLIALVKRLESENNG